MKNLNFKTIAIRVVLLIIGVMLTIFIAGVVVGINKIL
jgi:uncharacterized membrane protein